MKQCPNCKNTYTDDSLQFCLTDGATLELLPMGEPTIAFDKNRMPSDFRTNPEPESVETVFPPVISPQITSDKKGINWIVISVLSILLIFVLLGFAGFAGYVFYSKGADENRNAVVNTPTPKISPTPDEKLKEKVANLEKQIENQKTINSPNPFPNAEVKERTARANSPGDGFLALRSLPSTAAGERLAKIPHGAQLTVIDCPKPTNPGKIKGRWCRVNYEGIEGWAFDAYMIFD